MEDYKVESVDTCRLMSHEDFISLPQVYQLRKVRDGALVRLKLPKRLGWKAGEVVRLAPHAVHSRSVF